MLYAFIASASYSGNLRAFLSNPSTTEPIGTVEDVLASGLPWNMVLYGEEVESHLSLSPDPTLRRFWDEKEVALHETVPYERVRRQGCQDCSTVRTLVTFTKSTHGVYISYCVRSSSRLFVILPCR